MRNGVFVLFLKKEVFHLILKTFTYYFIIIICGAKFQLTYERFLKLIDKKFNVYAILFSSISN